jgi:ribose/xylose/arabinose/galactoside ABC-type transport system permease subunit
MKQSRLGLIRHGIVAALIVEVVFFSVVAEHFLEGANLKLIVTQAAVIGLIAVPSALLLLSGYVDFAIGSEVAVAAVVFAAVADDASLLVAVAAAFAVAITIGAVQGVLSVVLGFSPLIVGLGFLSGLRGLALVVTGGVSLINVNGKLEQLGSGSVLGTGIPIPVAIAAAAFMVGAVVLHQTRVGRHVLAIGSNPAAAFRAGISQHRIPVVLYIATAASCALGGLILVGKLDSAPPTLAIGLELQVLGAVLLGGVAFGGGRGSLIGVLAGVLFMGVLNNGLLLLGVPPYWFQVASGAALVFAAGLDVLGRGRPGMHAGGATT